MQLEMNNNDIDKAIEIADRNLKEYNYNYVVLTPYTFKHMFMVNETFINESSLKHFINNLHAANVGVMFKFDTECFCDYEYGLNDLDGASIYNLEEDKIKEI